MFVEIGVLYLCVTSWAAGTWPECVLPKFLSTLSSSEKTKSREKRQNNISIKVKILVKIFLELLSGEGRRSSSILVDLRRIFLKGFQNIYEAVCTIEAFERLSRRRVEDACGATMGSGTPTKMRMQTCCLVPQVQKHQKELWKDVFSETLDHCWWTDANSLRNSVFCLRLVLTLGLRVSSKFFNQIMVEKELAFS